MIDFEALAPGIVQPRVRAFGLVKAWQSTPRIAAKTALPGPKPAQATTKGFESLTSRLAQRLLLPTLENKPAKSQKLYVLDNLEPEREGSNGSRDSTDSAAGEPQNSLALILSALLQPPLPILLQDGPLTWHKPLLEHQQQGIAQLIAARELLLADEMGLGKTIQALGALRILAYSGLLARSLIVAPASLLRQWQKEAALWAPELVLVRVTGSAQQRAALWRLPAHIHLVAYETLREDIAASPVSGQPWDVVVLDEASKIRNAESLVSRSVKRLPANRRWALTGTPLENRVEDLHSILDFLLGAKRDRSDLQATLAHVQLRRRKAAVLQSLPPKTVITLEIELGAAQRGAYEAAERDGIYRLKSLGPALTITHVLELLMRLKQLCNVDPISGESAKLDDIEQRLETLVASDERALIFSQFVSDTFGVGLIATRLAPFKPLVFSGALNAERRAQVVEAFATDTSRKALILSLMAGGLGLNLQSASYVFHLDRWWNPAIEDQAEARSHRMGQPLPVTVYRYVSLDTIEERIEHLLQDKRELFAQVVEGVSIAPEKTFSREELFGLLGL